MTPEQIANLVSLIQDRRTMAQHNSQTAARHDDLTRAAYWNGAIDTCWDILEWLKLAGVKVEEE